MSGNLDFWRVPSTLRTDLRVAHGGLNCTNNVVYVEHLFSFWESGILAGARQTVPT